MAKKKKQTKKAQVSKKVTNVRITKQAGTDRTYYATWTWNEANTDKYEVKWSYSTWQGVLFTGSDTSTEDKNSLYTAPDNANSISVIIRPVAKTRTVKKKQVAYWTADWSVRVTLTLGAVPPETPPVPTVEIDNYDLTASLNYYGTGTQIQFEIVQNDSSTIGIATVGLATNHAAHKRGVSAGNRYKVRARAIKDGNNYSSWSEYSDSSGTVPTTPSGFTSVSAASDTAVKLTWNAVNTATEYDIEYTSEREYFDTSGEVQSQTITSGTTANITGLETGKTWFFRLRAKNDKGESGWCAPASCVIGLTPSPPTTWSSSTSVVAGEEVTLNWIHNAEDNSAQTAAILELTVNGTTTTHTFTTETSYNLTTSNYADGTAVSWRAKTKGVMNEYSDWSTQRNVTVHAPVSLSVTGVGSTVTSLPISMVLSIGVGAQVPMSYHVSIVSQDEYETVDFTGQPEYIYEGQEVFSRHYDESTHPLNVTLGAGDVNLDNNIDYILRCSVSTDAGITATTEIPFSVSWSEEEIVPDAQIGLDDEDSVSVFIRPYCTNLVDDEDTEYGEEDAIYDPDVIENLVPGVLLSVYRREFDGTLVEIASGIQNDGSTVVIDPHPALDYAKYRIVATNQSTGAVSYNDLPGYPIGETAIILQWNEQWNNFAVQSESDEQYDRESSPWAGSFIRLPWNIDISDQNRIDVSLTEYIGRRTPVSYYGTQIGQTSSWSTDIRADDEETLYALRKLAVWMGDVYVREPSGSGYWAQINVSFSRKHGDMVVPVKLDITRVEGGI